MNSDLLIEEDYEEMKKIKLIDPIHVNTVIADGAVVKAKEMIDSEEAAGNEK